MPVWMVTGAKLKTSYSLDHCWRPAVKYGLMCMYTVRVSLCKYANSEAQAYKCCRYILSNIACVLRD